MEDRDGLLAVLDRPPRGSSVSAMKMKVVHLLDLLPDEEEYAYFNSPKEGFLTSTNDVSKPHDLLREAVVSPAKSR
jgi:hypothetical protein